MSRQTGSGRLQMRTSSRQQDRWATAAMHAGYERLTPWIEAQCDRAALADNVNLPDRSELLALRREVNALTEAIAAARAYPAPAASRAALDRLEPDVEKLRARINAHVR